MVAYHLKMGRTLLHDVVGINSEKGATTDIKSEVPSIWAKVCMLDSWGCVI